MSQQSDADRMVVANSDNADALNSRYHASVTQGYRGFQQDCVQVLEDWSGFIHGVQVPLVLVHGMEAPTVRISTVQNTLTRHSEFEFRALLGQGQLVWCDGYRSPHALPCDVEMLE